MMRGAIVVMLLAACSKSANQDCEGLKSKYLAWVDARVKVALETPGGNRELEAKNAAEERAQADSRFVGACHDIKLDATCWVDDMPKERKQECRAQKDALDTILYKPD